jgi:PKD repeat protein
MLKHFLTALVAIAFSFNFLSAQSISSNGSLDAKEITTPRRCGTTEHHQMLLQQNPGLAQIQQQIENQTQNWIQNHYNNGERVVYTIPVVFHVVYQNATENISDQRLMDQLDVLNKDFRRLNTDVGNVPSAWTSITADCEINFCLATLDPNGNATTGIVRVSTTDGSFSDDDQVKYTSQGGSNAWPRASYLNLWVCDLGGGLLGYAQFPGGTAATDGVVLNYRYTGVAGSSAPYNKGRTATHEVGHWLNLRHIWGDDGGACSGSDQVSDTPNQAGEHYGCYTVGQVLTDACTGSAPGIMWMNYMDYTDDACMYMFTNGQKARVQATMAGSRNSLVSSLGCTSSNTVNANFTSNVTSGCAALTVNFTDQSTGTPTSWSWSFPGGTPSTSTLQNPTVVYNTPGTYSVTLTATNSTSNDSQTQTNYITVTAITTGLTLPFAETFESNSFTTNNWTIVNGDAADTWTIVTTTGTTPGTKSAKMDYFNYNGVGERDALVTPALNFSGLTSAQVYFEHAYRRYNNASSDSLILYLSSNCGPWIRVQGWGESGGGTFATATNSTTSFNPSGSTQWCMGAGNAPCYTINLTPYIGSSSVKLKFEGYNNYGNNLYIDNINVTGVVATIPPVANFNTTATTVCEGGSITFNDASTNLPTSWAWDFGGGGTPNTSTTQSPTIIFNTAGTYTVTLTATNAYGSDAEVRTNYITVYAPLNSSISGTTPASCSGANGSATVTATGGSGVYTYLWSNGQTTATATNLISGTYTVTVTGGCTDIETANVSGTFAPTVTTSSTQVSCNGGADGTATANASGGSGSGYTFVWSNSQTTQTITGLTGGSYTVTVTDSAGCTTTSTIAVTNPTALSATMASTPESTTSSNNGTAQANVSGGTPPYTYSWSNGGSTQTITGLSTGTFTVTITDSKGCTFTNTVTVGLVLGVGNTMSSYVELYPNPSDGIVNFNWQLTAPGEMKVRVTNSIGQVIYDQPMMAPAKGETQINLQPVSPGIYFLQVSGKELNQVFRLIVE